MRQFVESLRRLYQNGKVDSQKLDELRHSEKITENELKYILQAH